MLSIKRFYPITKKNSYWKKKHTIRTTYEIQGYTGALTDVKLKIIGDCSLYIPFEIIS